MPIKILLNSYNKLFDLQKRKVIYKKENGKWAAEVEGKDFHLQQW